MARKSANLKAMTARANHAWAVLFISGSLGLSQSLSLTARANAPLMGSPALVATLQPSDEGEREYNVDEEMPEPKAHVAPPPPPETATPKTTQDASPGLPEVDVDDESMARADEEKAKAKAEEEKARAKSDAKADAAPDISLETTHAAVKSPANPSAAKKRQPPPIHVLPPGADDDKDKADDKPESAEIKPKGQSNDDKAWRKDDDFESTGVMGDARRVMPQVTPANKTAPGGKSKLIVHTDISGQFSYILPDNWGTYAIPMQHHDVLACRDDGSTQASISFADGDRHSDLESVKEKALKERKDAFDKFVIVSDREITLPGDQKCVRVIATANIDEQPSRQVVYIVSPKKHYNLVVTMTVAKSVGDKYDRALLHIVNSISTK